MPVGHFKTLFDFKAPWARVCFVATCLTASAIYGAMIAFHRSFHVRDFDVHREVGRRFLSGQYLYADGLCYPYMPAAAMYFSPLALIDRNMGLALRYMVAVICLCVTLALLFRMARAQFDALHTGHLTVSVLTVLLAFQFVLQDLDDGGPHLILLLMLTAGMYAAWRERDVAAGLWFGLTIALKITPALFVLFFLWKRRWRLAACTVLAACVWIVLPLTWMGPSNWWNHQAEWAANAGLSLADRHTGIAEENEQRVRNQSLRLSLMRYLVAYPENHPIRRDDPDFTPILDLPPQLAQGVVVMATLGLMGVLAWATRKPWRGPNDPDWLRQCAAMCILLLLLSPITWQQHLVWLIPALYIVVADILVGGRISMPRAAAFSGYIVLTMVLNYEVLGKHRFAMVLSYHPFAIAMLLVLGLLMLRVRNGTDLRWAPGGVHRPAVQQEEGSGA